MLPQSQPRKKPQEFVEGRISPISFVFHGVDHRGAIYFAAREGYARQTDQENHRDKMEERRKSRKSRRNRPRRNRPRSRRQKLRRPRWKPRKRPPPAAAPPVVAPRAGGCAVALILPAARPCGYRERPRADLQGYMEYVLRSKWNRPENMAGRQLTSPRWRSAVDQQGKMSAPPGRKAPAMRSGTTREGGLQDGQQDLTAGRPRIFRPRHHPL